MVPAPLPLLSLPVLGAGQPDSKVTRALISNIKKVRRASRFITTVFMLPLPYLSLLVERNET
jgi:hypothetical protein